MFPYCGYDMPMQVGTLINEKLTNPMFRSGANLRDFGFRRFWYATGLVTT